MKTRTEYLDGKCTCDEYYNQFVTNRILDIVRNNIGEREYLMRMLGEDKNLNNIPLGKWDSLVLCDKSIGSVDEQGNGIRVYSLSNGVCVLKAAARMIAEEKEL